MRKDGKRFSLYLIAALILVSIASFMMLRSEAEDLQLTKDSAGYYLIATSADLKQFREAVNAGSKDINAKLTANIDLEGTSDNQWTPIRSFSGTFDGGGFTISGLYINEGNSENKGFIGTLAGGAEVSGLTIEGTVIGGGTLGGIVGKNNGTVKNCASNCEKVSGSEDYVGGIVGENNGTVTNCASNCKTVSGSVHAGGIVGRNGSVSGTTRGTVTNCASNCVAVSGSGDSGGVVGWNNKGTVTNCASNCGAVSGGKNVGGVVGISDGTVTNCASNCGAVSGSDYVGGVVGRNMNATGTVTNCGWLYTTTTTSVPSVGVGAGNSTHVVSYDADASKTVVTACVSPLSVTVAKDRSAVVPFALAPGADASAAMYIETLSADVASAGIASADVASGKVTVTGRNYGTTAMAVSYKFKYTDFSKTPLSVSDGSVAVSANVGITVQDFAVTPKSATIAVGGTSKLTASGGSAAGGVTWDVSGDAVSLDKKDGTSIAATGVRRGTATVTATTKDGETDYCDITVNPATDPADPLPAENQTDKDGTGSGVLIISPDTYESFKVYDALIKLGEEGRLPDGITIASLDAVPAASTDLSIDCYIQGTGGKTSGDIIAGAIKDYWGITDTSPEKLRLVSAVSATAHAGSDETTLAKFWRILVDEVRKLLGYDNDKSTDSAYLPLQTNFTITSADIALLSDDIKTELNAGNLLDKVNLFAVVKSGDEYAARSLNDAADNSGASRGKYMTVSEDKDGNYRISTRIMLFNLPGTVSGDKTMGASWILPISSDKTSDDYFLVQDGAKDDTYAVAMALAVKTPNYATVHIATDTTSGDTPVSYDTAVTGKKGYSEKITSSDWSNAEMSGDVYTVTFAKVAGYSISVNDGSEAYTVSKDLAWGASWDVKATYSKIYVSGVSLDKTALVLAPGGSDKLTATVTPDDAYAKDVTWTTSDKNIAEIAADGTVTAKAAGKATITATANDGGGASAACAVTVRNNAGDDPTAPSLTPELVTHAIARPAEIELADNTASYVTDAAKQTTVATAAGFKDEDTALTATGALAAGSTVVNGAVNDVIAKDPTVSKDIVYALPIVESKADKAGMLHAISFKVSGDIFGEVTGAEIRVLKVFPDGTGELFTPISAPEEIADKTAALYDTNEAMVTGAIDKEADYILTIFVKDGESFDLDGNADGTVIDPVSIIKAAAAEPDQPDNTRSHNGGCNTGAALPLLAAMAAVLIIRKKR